MSVPNEGVLAADFHEHDNPPPEDRISGILPSSRQALAPLSFGDRAGSKTVDDLMSHPTTTVRTSSKVRTAVEMFRSPDVRHLPVVDERNVLVGMLSDRDLQSLHIPYFIESEYVGNLKKVLDSAISHLVKGPVVSIDAGSSAAEAFALMIHGRMALLPVTDAAGVLVGVITYLEILRELSLDDESYDDAE